MPKHIMQEHLDSEHFDIAGDNSLTRKHEYGKLRLSASSNITCTNADQYYQITGTFTDDGDNIGFTTSDSTDDIKSNIGGKLYHLVGVSDVGVDKACKLTYSLFKNGSDTGKSTPHDFDSPSKTENISITDLINIANGDEFDIRVKSDQANTIASVNTLNVIFKW